MREKKVSIQYIQNILLLTCFERKLSIWVKTKKTTCQMPSWPNWTMFGLGWNGYFILSLEKRIRKYFSQSDHGKNCPSNHNIIRFDRIFWKLESFWNNFSFPNITKNDVVIWRFFWQFFFLREHCFDKQD